MRRKSWVESHASLKDRNAHTDSARDDSRNLFADDGEEAEMIKFGVVALLVAGVCWLFGGLIGGLFKLTFGLAGALFGGLIAVLAATVALLIVVPVVLFALLPLLAPLLVVAGVVWLVVRASRPHSSATAAPH
jgi:hypothetical protein